MTSVLRGEWSSRPEPTIMFTWEGLLAQVPVELVGREQRLVAKGKWRKAFACWEQNLHMRQVLVDLTWRKERQIEVLTYYPEPFAEELSNWVDREGYPCSGVHCGYPKETFETKLTMMPWVAVVYHSEQDPMYGVRLLYGSKGQYIDPSKYSGSDL